MSSYMATELTRDTYGRHYVHDGARVTAVHVLRSSTLINVGMLLLPYVLLLILIVPR